MGKLLDFVQFNNLNTWSIHLLLENNLLFTDKYPMVYFKEFTKKGNIEKVDIKDDKTYKILGVRSYGLGAYLNREVLGSTLKMKKYQKAKKDHLFWCKVDTKNGAFGIITDELEDGLGSSNMTFAELNSKEINVNYLQLFFQSKKFNAYMDNQVVGTTNRKYIKFNDLLNEIQIPLPKIDIQEQIVENYQTKIELANQQEQNVINLEKEIEDYLYKELGLNKNNVKEENKLLSFISFEDLSVWSCKDILDSTLLVSDKFKTYSLNQKPTLFEEVFRGKSPKYDETSKSFILNQKCNRWNDLELKHSKKVNQTWFEKIDKKFFTKEGDILINSTGDGTIGRATCITKKFENLIYDSHILLLRLNKSEVNPLFLTYFINSNLGQKQIENIKSAVATKQTELGINNLKNLQFVIPNIDIQDKIAIRINDLKNEIATLLEQSERNRIMALEEFEKEVFNEV
jgi:type I restriction enzyme, S subunit